MKMVFKKIYLFQILAFIIFFCFQTLYVNNATAQCLVISNILQRVFFIKYKSLDNPESFGSSFTIDVDGKQYLITAKHVVPNIKLGDKVEIFRDNKWVELNVKPIFCKNSAIDIAILALPVPISPSHELEPSSQNIILSQDVFFLGFPFGMNIESGGLNNAFPFPLVKKGIISAIDNKNGILYIDGNNNPGFSGEPIVFCERETNKLKVCGVVEGYLPQFNKVIQTDLLAKSNSGILIGYTIESAVEAIRESLKKE